MTGHAVVVFEVWVLSTMEGVPSNPEGGHRGPGPSGCTQLGACLGFAPWEEGRLERD